MAVEEFVTEWPSIEENKEFNEHLKAMSILNSSSPFLKALNMPVPTEFEDSEDYIKKLERKLNKIKSKPPIHAQVLTDAGNFYSKISVDDLLAESIKNEDAVSAPAAEGRTSDEYNSDIEGQNLLNSTENRTSIESNMSDAPLLADSPTNAKSVKKAQDYLAKPPVWKKLLSCCIYVDSDDD